MVNNNLDDIWKTIKTVPGNICSKIFAILTKKWKFEKQGGLKNGGKTKAKLGERHVRNESRRDSKLGHDTQKLQLKPFPQDQEGRWPCVEG